MAVNKLDLDIEFEDEEEAKRLEEERKKREEVKEVDLEFAVEPGEGDAGVSGAALKKAQAEARRAALEKKNAASGENVSNIEEARKARAPAPQQSEPSINFAKPEPTAVTQNPMRPSASSPHYRLGDELNYAMEANALLNAEVQARVQLAVAEAKTEIVAKAAQEAKLLEHKIVKLLTQAHAKAPAAKAELMAIKKMLAEYSDPKNLLGESPTAASDKPQAAPVKKKA